MVGQTKRLIYGKIYSQRFTTAWTVRRSNPDGGEFSALVLVGRGAHPASYAVGTGSFLGVKRASGHGMGRGAHPASYAVGTGSFPGVKRGSRHGINRPPRSSAEVKYRTHSSICKTTYTDACKTYYTISVYTTVFLKMNPRVRNM
jgi:hypothetical protein